MIVSVLNITSLTFGHIVLETGQVDELWYSAPTTIQIDCDTLSLGKVHRRETKRVSFHIRNIGDLPLWVVDIRPFCECTSVSWNRHPVNPGQKMEVTVVFEPHTLGEFLKSIDIICNTTQHVHQLKLKGVIIE